MNTDDTDHQLAVAHARDVAVARAEVATSANNFSDVPERPGDAEKATRSDGVVSRANATANQSVPERGPGRAKTRSGGGEREAGNAARVDVVLTDDDRADVEAAIKAAASRKPVYFHNPNARQADESLNDYQVRIGNAFQRADSPEEREQLYAAFVANLPDDEATILGLIQRVRPEAWSKAQQAPDSVRESFLNWRKNHPEASVSAWPLQSLGYVVGPGERVYRRTDAITDSDNPMAFGTMSRQLMLSRYQQVATEEQFIAFVAENPDWVASAAMAMAGGGGARGPQTRRPGRQGVRPRRPSLLPQSPSSDRRSEQERLADHAQALAAEPGAEFYATADPTAVLEAPVPNFDDKQAMVQRGRAAVDAMLSQVHNDTKGDAPVVLDAMFHPEIGRIHFYWGHPGRELDKKKKTELDAGYGISHILAKHGPEAMTGVINAIAHGQPFFVESNKRAEILHDGFHVSIERITGSWGQNPNWVVTGFDAFEGGKAERSSHNKQTRFNMQRLPRHIYFRRQP